MQLNDFDFILPPELIAQYPKKIRSNAKLLIADSSKIEDKFFYQLIDFLNTNDLLIFNDTRVIAARIFAHKISGAKLEVLITKILSNYQAEAMIKSSKGLKTNNKIIINDKYCAKVLAKKDAVYQLEFNADILEIIDKVGHIPLPPYIKRADNDNDNRRYQSIFARELGAVAAPTASLHFDKQLLNAIQVKGINSAFITLHIGSATFSPIRVNNISEHKMHTENFSVNQETINKIIQTKKNGGRIICVGTTTLRALETIALSKLKSTNSKTDIFIYPGFKFKLTDALITNFHLPKSSLFILVSAFVGSKKIKNIYNYAIKHKYSFFSYGDAMLLFKKQ